MRIRDLVWETGSALDANRGRSLLTVLGIVIGIAAVIAMTALIGGVKQSLVGELGLNQARMVDFFAWPEREVTLDDLKNLEERMPEYECLTATSYANGEVKSETKTFSGTIMGVLPNYERVMGVKMTQGSFIKDRDQDSVALVAVLDQGAVKQLYGSPDEQVVGRTISISNVSYSVVGVSESTSYMGNGGTVYLPFSTCASRLTGDWGIGSINGLAREDADMSTIAETTMQTLADYFQMSEDQAKEDVYAYTMQSVIDELETTMASFQLLMTAVASISLVVGGIGIMNMMLTNVTERIREIGLRKALGARSSDITKQFLLESVCLCLAGGFIGVVLGYLGSFALTGVAGSMMELGATSAPLRPMIDVKSVAMVTGICILIGVLFGYYPARRAARLDPVESLHYQ